MPELGNTTDNRSDEQFLIMQATIESNKKETDEKPTKTHEKLKIS